MLRAKGAYRPNAHARESRNQGIAEVAFRKLGLRTVLQLIAANLVILPGAGSGCLCGGFLRKRGS